MSIKQLLGPQLTRLGLRCGMHPRRPGRAEKFVPLSNRITLGIESAGAPLTFPGFMIPSGSIACLIVFIRPTVPGPSSSTKNSFFPIPTPCSPVPERKRKKICDWVLIIFFRGRDTGVSWVVQDSYRFRRARARVRPCGARDRAQC